MKRSPSPHTPPSSSSTPSPKRAKPSPGKGGSHLGQWTAENKARLIEMALNAGFQALKLDDIARELDLNKTQIADATKKGKRNLRDKVIKYAGTC